MKTTRIVLGLPWYSGPDVDSFPLYFEMLHYMGRVRERSLWFQQVAEHQEVLKGVSFSMAPLDPINEWGDAELAEIGPEDGVFEFFIAKEVRMSLPGLARERVVDMALSVGADWLFMWDHDMLFSPATLMRLWRHQKPVVNALAFTARDPIQPCLYRIIQGVDPNGSGTMFDSQAVWDFPRGKLITDEDVDGSLAFGAGVMLINMNVFRQMPKPWFNATGCGEDWFFCVRCHQVGIPRYCDTSMVVKHKKYAADWYDVNTYDQERLAKPEVYKKLMERTGAV